MFQTVVLEGSFRWYFQAIVSDSSCKKNVEDCLFQTIFQAIKMLLYDCGSTIIISSYHGDQKASRCDKVDYLISRN